MNRMRPAVPLLLFLLLAGTVLSSPSETAVTGDVSGQLRTMVESLAEEGVGGKVGSLVASLADILEDARRYQGKMASASAEDSLVLQLQFENAQDRFVAVIQKLGTVTSSGGDDSALRSSLVAIYRELTKVIWWRVGEERQIIDNWRADRLQTAPGDRASLEAKIAHATDRLDGMLEFTRTHLLHLNRMGEDTEADRKVFQELLQDRADELSGRLELGMLRTRELARQLQDRPGDADLSLVLSAVRTSLDTNTASLKKTLDLMAAEGIPDKELRAKLVSITQDVTSGIMDVRVAATLLRRTWRGMTNWVHAHGPGLAMKVILVVFIFLIGWLVARLVQKAVSKSLEKARLNISKLMVRTIVSFAHKIILGLTLMVVLAQFNISLGPLLAGLGVVGFILGFAMQDSLSNFASGLMILFYRPYDVGDLVEISGVFGKVEHMSMVSTNILTLDNQKLVVPNSKIWGDVIKNVTDQHIRRVDMTFGISYSDDIPKAERIFKEILDDCDMILPDPEPMIHLHELNDSSVDFIVRPWVKTNDYWDTYWAVTREVKMRFDAEGVSIPFPQQDVHFYRGKDETDAGD